MKQPEIFAVVCSVETRTEELKLEENQVSFSPSWSTNNNDPDD